MHTSAASVLRTHHRLSGVGKERVLSFQFIAEGRASEVSFPRKEILPVLFRSRENALLWLSGCWGYAGMQMPKMPGLQLAPVSPR